MGLNKSTMLILNLSSQQDCKESRILITNVFVCYPTHKVPKRLNQAIGLFSRSSLQGAYLNWVRNY